MNTSSPQRLSPSLSSQRRSVSDASPLSCALLKTRRVGLDGVKAPVLCF